jgi:hypothetical protein
MRLVVAKCLAFAWDSVACKGYEPDKGPLPGGLYEIDADSQLSTLTTIRKDWLFQYPGHEGKASVKGKEAVPAVSTATVQEIVEAKPTDAQIKAKRLENLAKARAAKKAKLVTVTA